jgi:glycosyltransferase involved in cell wall biosynthesis
VHVGLNLVFLVPGETGGMEVYARELIPELVAAAPGVRFTAFINREAAEIGDGPWNSLIESVTVPVRARNRVGWVRGEQEHLPRLAARAGVDVLHSLASTAPAWGRFRRVVTIHDLNYRIVPEAHLGIRGLGMRVLVPLAARRSDRIITDSENTRRDLHQLLQVPPSSVDVVPLGVRTTGRPEPTPEAALRRELDAGDRPIVLSVSAQRPHKNVARLIGALALLPAERRPLLVVPGYQTSHGDELHARSAELGVQDDIRFLGWVSEAELEGLYGAAACFAFPSLYEGFGLPVLEAMAAGTVPITGHSTALPEVAGDAGMLVDVSDVEAIADAIVTVIEDTAFRDKLRLRGLERSKLFSWERAAQATWGVFAQALDQ